MGSLDSTGQTGRTGRTGSSQGLDATAQQAIQEEQRLTVENNIEAKRNEAAFQRAMAWLNQPVG